MRLVVALVVMFFCVQPLAAEEIKTGDDLAQYICESRSPTDCEKARKFLKLMENRKPAKRMLMELSGTEKLIGEAREHFNKKSRFIKFSLEDTINGVWEQAETEYTRDSQWSKWTKVEK
jgi:hypothetical protein